MTLKYKIHPDSPLEYEDFIEVIKNFNNEGKVIDDRGRNLIKSFKRKNITINVKSFKVPHLINKIAYKYFRASKARRSYEHGCLLIDKHIGTPQPLAYFEYANIFGIQESYYFSEHLKYDLTYRELRGSPVYPDQERILRQFTKFTYALHEEGIFFKDHSAGNTLIVKNGKDYLFYLIDLNRMDFYEMDLDARMKNFSKLTEDVDIVKIMSDEYATLSALPYDVVFDKMWEQISAFRNKYERRQNLKQRFKGTNQ